MSDARHMEAPARSDISFSFGENWLQFLDGIDDIAIGEADRDIELWLGPHIADARIVDIGSGSGLSSLCLHRRGCRHLISFDADPKSVAATSELAKREGDPPNWSIRHGSILDATLVERLGKFDIVHSWGVLHHTGDMWTALANAASLCHEGGHLFISIYAGGPRYAEHLELKRRYNRCDAAGKQKMIERALESVSIKRAKSTRRARGMTVYHDMVDWLGGLPYEVAHVSEILWFCMSRGFQPLRVFEKREGGCSVFLLRRATPDPQASFEWWSVESPEPALRQFQEQLGADIVNHSAPLQAELSRRRANAISLGRWVRRLIVLAYRRISARVILSLKKP